MAFKDQDHYKVLGVPRTASKKEIRAAYRKRARKCHPDVNKSPSAEERFKEINEAHNVLSDTAKRQQYDQQRKRKEAEQQRRTEEQRKREEVERQRQTDEQRKREETERQRLAEEQRKREEAERQRQTEEQRKRVKAERPRSAAVMSSSQAPFAPLPPFAASTVPSTQPSVGSGSRKGRLWWIGASFLTVALMLAFFEVFYLTGLKQTDATVISIDERSDMLCEFTDASGRSCQVHAEIHFYERFELGNKVSLWYDSRWPDHSGTKTAFDGMTVSPVIHGCGTAFLLLVVAFASMKIVRWRGPTASAQTRPAPATTAPSKDSCSQCGGAIPRNDYVCPHCGHTLWGPIACITAVAIGALAVGILVCDPGLWRWVWIGLGCLCLLGVACAVLKSLIWSLTHSPQKWLAAAIIVCCTVGLWAYNDPRPRQTVSEIISHITPSPVPQTPVDVVEAEEKGKRAEAEEKRKKASLEDERKQAEAERKRKQADDTARKQALDETSRLIGTLAGNINAYALESRDLRQKLIGARVALLQKYQNNTESFKEALDSRKKEVIDSIIKESQSYSKTGVQWTGQKRLEESNALLKNAFEDVRQPFDPVRAQDDVKTEQFVTESAKKLRDMNDKLASQKAALQEAVKKLPPGETTDTAVLSLPITAMPTDGEQRLKEINDAKAAFFAIKPPFVTVDDIRPALASNIPAKVPDPPSANKVQRPPVKPLDMSYVNELNEGDALNVRTKNKKTTNAVFVKAQEVFTLILKVGDKEFPCRMREVIEIKLGDEVIYRAR